MYHNLDVVGQISIMSGFPDNLFSSIGLQNMKKKLNNWFAKHEKKCSTIGVSAVIVRKQVL